MAIVSLGFLSSCAVELRSLVSAVTPAPTSTQAQYTLAFATQPSATSQAGTNFASQPVVEIRSSSGTAVSTATDTITLAAYTDATCSTLASGGTLSSASIAAVGGVATFVGVDYTKVSTVYLKATSGSHTSACSNAVSITAGAAAQVAFTTQPSTTATASTDFATQPVVEVQDAFGNLITTSAAVITLTAYTNSTCTVAAGGTLNGGSATASSGVATFSGVDYSANGTIFLRASTGALTTACSGGVGIGIGPASQLVFSTEPSNTATAGTDFATQPVVQVQDAGGNIVPSNTAVVTLTAYTDAACTTTAATGTLNGGAIAASSGVATFTGVDYSKAETIYLKASQGAFTTDCSTAVVVSAGAASVLVYTTEPSTTATAGTDFATQPVVEIRDALGNLLSSSTLTIALTAYTDSACTTTAATGTLNGGSKAAVAGVATFTTVDYSKAETIYLKASNGALTTDCSTAVAVGVGAASQVVFSTEPSTTATAGVDFTTQPVVQVQDAQGNLITSSTATIALNAYTDAACTTTAATGTLNSGSKAAVAGVATFTGVDYSKAETIYLKASTGALTTDCSTAIAVSVGSASQVAFSTEPSATATAATDFATQPVVEVRDNQGNLISSSTLTITLTAYTDSACTTTAATGTLNGGSKAAVAGVATFTTVDYSKAETIYLKASTGALTTDCSTAVAVSAGAASKVVFTTEPSTTATAATDFATQPVVEVQDAQGNVITSSTATIALAAYTDSACTTTAATGTLNGGSVAASSGVATFTTVDYSKSETIYLRASTGALTTDCSTGIAVGAAAASVLVFTTEPSATATAGTDFSTQPVVAVRDAQGNLTASTATITLTAYTDSACTTTAATGTLNGGSIAASSGVATFTGVDYSKAETIYLKASTGALTTDCSTAVAVSASAASVLVYTTEPSATATAGTDFATQPVVEVRDAQGNLTASTATITLTAYTDSACTTTAATGTLNGGSKAAVAGVATFTTVDYSKAETIYLKASTGALTTDCSTAVAVSAGSATQLAYSTQPSATGTAAADLSTQPVVQVRDAQGNVVTGSSAVVTITAYTDSACTTTAATGTLNGGSATASSGVATFSGIDYSKVETIYLKAASGALTIACSDAVVISAAAASVLAFSTEPSTTATAGTDFATQPVVQVRDASGNVVASSSAAVTITAYTDSACTTTAATGTLNSGSATASSGVATFSGMDYSKAETIYLKASSGALTTDCSTAVAVSYGSATQLVYSTEPSTTATAGADLATQPVVQVRDAQGNVVANSGITVTLTAYTDSACTTTAATGTLNGGSVAASSGVATFTSVDYSKVETIYLKAASGALTTDCSTGIAVSASAASVLVYTTEPSTTATAGSDFATQPVVEVRDAQGNVVTGSSATIALTAYTDSACTTTAATGTLNGGSVAASSGVATFTSVDYSKAETIYLKASTGALTTDCSTAIAVSPSAASVLVYTTEPSTTATAATDFATQPVVEVRDAQGNLTTSTATITLTAYTDSACTTTAATGTLNSGSKAAVAGVATFTGVDYSKAETIYLKASTGALTTDCSTAIAVSAGAAAVLVYTTEPSATATAASDFATQPVVEIRDAQGNLTTSTLTITLTAYTDSACTTTAATGTLNGGSKAGVTGVATFTTVDYSKAETIYLLASTGALTTDCSTAVVVSAGAASVVAFTTEPATTATAGTDLTTQPVVEVRDAQGNVVTSSSATIALTAFTDSACTTTAATGTLNGGSVAASSGVATFTGVDYTKAETIYLKASTGALTTDCSTAIAVTYGAASAVVYTTQPVTTAPLANDFTTQPVLEVRDAYGNKVANSTLTITLTAYTTADCSTTAATGTLNGGSKAAVAGVATYTTVDYSAAETIYLKAASGALTVACSNAVVVNALFQAYSSVTVGAGSEPQYIATGDFDRDGHQDFIVTEQSNDRFSVFLGNGDGTFDAKVNYATGANTDPRAIKASDLDNDGDLDLVVTYWTPKSMVIWLNNGSAVFSAGSTILDGSSLILEPYVGDVNKDGKADIVIGRFNNLAIRVHIGAGDGTFAAGVDYAASGQPVFLDGADFDRDGDIDIVTSSWNTTNMGYIPNNGNGTFGAKVNLGVVASQNGNFSIADLDNDGDPDIVVPEESGRVITVILGNGAGGFAAKVSYNTSATGVAGARTIDAVVRDVNRDGILDIVVSLKTPDQIEVLIGVGNGTFGSPISALAQPAGALGAASADFNEDGEDDFITTSTTAGNVTVFLATPQTLPGTFTAQTATATIAEPRDVVAGDLNRDGKLDLVVASSSAGASLVRVQTGVGNGTFNAGSNYNLGVASATNTNIVRLATGDFNKDGKLDVATTVADSDLMTVMLGDGAGALAAGTTYATGTDPRHLAVGDMDNDGDPDIAVANHDSNNVSVFINDGTGAFAAKVDYATDTGPVSVSISDLNRNGKADLAVATDTAKTSTLLGVGDGTFAAAASYTAPNGGGDIQVRDITRDGKPDLIIAQGIAQSVTVYPGDGSGAFSTANSTSVGQTVENLGFGDFDADGDVDVACTLTSGTERFTTIPNTGGGTLGTPVNVTSGNVPQGLATGDFNKDGALDFVTALWGDSQIQVFLGTR
jgi:hypothetical protein